MAADPVPGPSTGPHRPSPPVGKPSPSRPKRPPRKPSKDLHSKEEVTRTGMIWVAVSVGLVLLVLLIVFILQNQGRVTVHYFGAAGDLSLGMALFIAAVAGGVLVAISGTARILQLRNQRRHRPVPPAPPGPSATGRHEAAPDP